MTQRYAKSRFAALCLVFSILAGSATADCAQKTPDEPIIVALRQAEPFTSITQDGRPEGFSADLWQRVYQNMMQDRASPLAGGKPALSYVVLDTIDEQEAALKNCDVDLVISPLTITASRLQSHDFSQQYLSSGLALAVPVSSAIDFRSVIATVRQTLGQSSVLVAILGFLSFNLLMAYAVRRYLLAPPERQGHGIFGINAHHLLEATTRTIALRGVGDGYTTATAKLLEIFMAVVGTALSATIFGILTSAFVGSIGTQKAIEAEKLVTLRVATLKCSTAQDFLAEQYVALRKTIGQDDPLRPILEARIDWLGCAQGAPVEGPAEMQESGGLPGAVLLTRSWHDAARRLATGEVDAVLGDWVALTYLSRQGIFADQMEVLPTVFRNEPYGWGIARREGAQGFRNAIDSGLIAEMRSNHWRSDLERVLGAGSISPN